VTRRRGFAVLALTASGVALAAPGEASSGVFLYTDARTGMVTPLFAPPEKACIDASGSGAHNLTGSDVILYYDNECEHYLLVLVPGESLNMPFNSIGFVPSGGRTPPPAQAPAR
jgi:hypothetical protein